MKSLLLSEDQLAIEDRHIQLARAPEITSIRAAARALMRADPTAAMPDGARLLDRTLDLWLSRALFLSLSMDDPNPVALWTQAIAPYTRRGHTVMGSGTMIDTPDYIYRAARLDGSREYLMTVRGRAPATDLTFQITGNHSGREGFAMILQNNAFAKFPLYDIAGFEADADGTFSIVIGSDANHGRRNYMLVPPGPFVLMVRDMFNGWGQNPHAVTIRPVVVESRRPATDQEILQKLTADFPHYVAFWLRLIQWYSSGAPEANAPVGPSDDQSPSPGLFMKMRFRLADDEALVVTTRNISTQYFGVQTTDLWLMTPDPIESICSRNRAQSIRGDANTFTYVISRADPGVANWLDTGGSREGFVQYRWVGISRQDSREDIVQRCEVVKLADLTRHLPQQPIVNEAQRTAERDARAKEWQQRIAL